MNHHIHWQARAIPFQTGESVASALQRAGIHQLGRAPTGQALAVFCGIGQCQGCLIMADGQVTEACLQICRDGLTLQPLDGDADV
ncbi:2Fe-2S iron-sulfur cluster-binding protein [Cypionkella sp.]|jgi:hypothetical protein|uniref:2Fe-2S iron-sulfur cluster-binding protein n=1 Tax=Cypionkella sp. TaxID=2811411 RepID=UPI00271C89BD|nr:2Fe-2S iron-sulfur cluster-binding protein [Cypionkella sp.]MDO8986586.1 2Fe-2S iron-sulfur cluster-binding protein [Cypionkella sp.]MDP1576831.1 2Fe-2S iron-sulfur cluster-binding protein [Cypionkella sp.]MDP2050775.1 2Fe-2S iron-sulfur cluster-binding protein [Cypionkella sp.]